MTDDERAYRPRHLAPEDEVCDLANEDEVRRLAADDGAGASEPASPATAEISTPTRGRSARQQRVSRFVALHGWRALALPVLTVLAVLALTVTIANPPVTAEALITTTGGQVTDGPSASAGAAPSDPASGAPETSDPAAAPTPGYVQAGDSTLNVVPGQSGVLGTGGPLLTFDVEVEGGIGVDGAAFASAVEQILGDPRSWGAGGQMSFQRVSGGDVDFHVALVSPDHVESLCPGYNTNGFTSCRYGDRAVINLARWSIGVTDYDGHLAEYRQYVVNHEVGHYLGHAHVPCPSPGAKAPVMMQQTLGLAPCAINAWPYPNGPADDLAAPA